MKFRKQLDFMAIDQWKEMYIDYKGLKKLVSRMRKQIDTIEKDERRKSMALEANDAKLRDTRVLLELEEGVKDDSGEGGRRSSSGDEEEGRGPSDASGDESSEGSDEPSSGGPSDLEARPSEELAGPEGVSGGESDLEFSGSIELESEEKATYVRRKDKKEEKHVKFSTSPGLEFLDSPVEIGRLSGEFSSSPLPEDVNLDMYAEPERIGARRREIQSHKNGKDGEEGEESNYKYKIYSFYKGDRTTRKRSKSDPEQKPEQKPEVQNLIDPARKSFDVTALQRMSREASEGGPQLPRFSPARNSFDKSSYEKVESGAVTPDISVVEAPPRISKTFSYEDVLSRFDERARRPGFPMDRIVILQEYKSIDSLRKNFFRRLDEELQKINDFFSGKLDEVRELCKGILGELDLMRTTSVDDESGEGIRLRKELIEYGVVLAELDGYSQINFIGFRKILKKLDKNIYIKSKDAYLDYLETQPLVTEKAVLYELLDTVKNQYAISFEKGRNKEQLVKEFEDAIHATVSWKENTVFRDTYFYERRVQILPPKPSRPFKLLPLAISLFLLAVGMLLAIYYGDFFPLLSGNQLPARKGLVMMISIIILWTTEALPLYITALLIPFLAVLFRVLSDELDAAVPLYPTDAASFAFQSMLGSVTFLILGGFSISAALHKMKIDSIFALAMLKYLGGKQPILFVLSLMVLGWFLSMFVSNVTSPVLCTSLVLPILRDIDVRKRFIKTVLLGIAMSCNVGGMTTPIASPQSAVTIGVSEELGEPISFVKFLVVSIPVSFICMVICFGIVLLLFRPDIKRVPIRKREKIDLSWKHFFVLAVTAMTLVLWLVQPYLSFMFGPQGIISLLPTVLLFGFGVLDTNDFLSLPWNVVFLVSGGSLLGKIVENSRLLDIVSEAIVSGIKDLPLYISVLAFGLFMAIMASFASHTVAALIILPVVGSVGKAFGYTQLFLMCGGLLASAASPLPVSSFPNVNAVSIGDENGNTYLSTLNILAVGVPVTVISSIVVLTVGFLLLYIMELIF